MHALRAIHDDFDLRGWDTSKLIIMLKGAGQGHFSMKFEPFVGLELDYISVTVCVLRFRYYDYQDTNFNRSEVFTII